MMMMMMMMIMYTTLYTLFNPIHSIFISGGQCTFMAEAAQAQSLQTHQ